MVSDHPSDAAWFALARLYSSEHRYPDALRCVEKAASLSQVPYEALALHGPALSLHETAPAGARGIYRAQRASPYQGESSDMGKAFDAQLAEGERAPTVN